MLRLEPVVPVPPHWRPACIGRTQLRHVSGEVELRPWLSLRLRFYGRTARASDCVARNDQLHSAILLPAGRRIIGCHWLALTESTGDNGRCDNALFSQKIANRVRPVFRQAHVELVCSHAVGMAFHAER